MKLWKDLKSIINYIPNEESKQNLINFLNQKKPEISNEEKKRKEKNTKTSTIETIT